MFKSLRVLIGFIIVALLFYKIGFSEVYEVLLTVPISFLIILFLFVFLDMLIAAINLKVLLRPLVNSLKFRVLFSSYIYSWILSFLVPGKLGESSLVYFLRDKVSPKKTTTVFLLDKLITLSILGIFSVIGFLIFFGVLNSLLLLIILILLIALFFVVLSSWRIRKFIRKFILRKYSIFFKGSHSTFFNYLKTKKRHISLNMFITIFKLLLNASIFYLFFNFFFNQSINFFFIFFITSIGILTSIVPITSNGVGVREFFVLLLYAKLNVDLTLVLSVYSLIILANYVMLGLMLIILSPKLKKRFINKIY